MSAAAMAWAWEIVKSGGQPIASLVLLRLADRADPEGVCWPGHRRTASDLNVSQRQVQRVIKDLAALGLITVEERPGRAGLIALQLGAALPIAVRQTTKRKEKKASRRRRGDMVSPLVLTQGGDNMSLPGVTPCHPTGVTPCHPEPQRNLTFETTTMDPVVVWSDKLTPAQVVACAAEAAAAPEHVRQVIADELAGAMAMSAREVRNPAGWVRAVAKRVSSGRQSVWHFADAIATARTRAAQPPPAPPAPAPMADPAVVAAGLQRLAELRHSFTRAP